MAFPWHPDEDAIVRRHIAGEFDIHDAADLLPRRTIFAIKYRANAIKNGNCKIYEPQKPKLAPDMPKGITAAQVEWALNNGHDKQAALILGWAQEGPVRL